VANASIAHPRNQAGRFIEEKILFAIAVPRQGVFGSDLDHSTTGRVIAPARFELRLLRPSRGPEQAAQPKNIDEHWQTATCYVEIRVAKSRP